MPSSDDILQSLALSDPPPEVLFQGKTFVLVDFFEDFDDLVLGTRAWCDEAIQVRGGKRETQATEETDYVVIGQCISHNW